MKAVILAGGRGTRISEESDMRPKPMVEIGGRPILWHILKLYGAHGLNDFVICCGYKGELIKQYFASYFLRAADFSVDLERNQLEIHRTTAESWRVTLVDTGLDTMTGGRLKRAAPYLGRSDFCMTYGDGVGDIDVRALIAFHRERGRLATVTAVRPPAQFGALRIAGDRVERFREKPADEGWINGGFFVLSPRVLDYIDGDATVWERDPLERLAREGQLSVYQHGGFWQHMDTVRDRRKLEELWASGTAPWKTWS